MWKCVKVVGLLMAGICLNKVWAMDWVFSIAASFYVGLFAGVLVVVIPLKNHFTAAWLSGKVAGMYVGFSGSRALYWQLSQKLTCTTIHNLMLRAEIWMWTSKHGPKETESHTGPTAKSNAPVVG